jgi:glutamate carboxypeptidase
LITVLISPDEEIASVAERDLITSLAAEHDITLSCEGADQDDRIRMATTGIELAMLTVKGRASHAGVAPELGRNALYELSHQILQMRDLLTGTRRQGELDGIEVRKRDQCHPGERTAIGDMRANKLEDLDAVKSTMRERIRNQLIADTTVELRFEEFFPRCRCASSHSEPVSRRARSTRSWASHCRSSRQRRGTDAAFAAMKTQTPVLEGFGLRNFGSHSNNAEYINISRLSHGCTC